VPSLNPKGKLTPFRNHFPSYPIFITDGGAVFELKACDERLSTGATVKELQLVGDRLRGLDARL